MTEPLHNNPPAVDPETIKGLKDRLNQLNELAALWLQEGELKSEAQSRKLTDVVTAARKLKSDIEAQRKKDKEPWLERGRAVDAAFGDLSNPVEKITNALKNIQGKWLAKKAEEARRQKAEEEARLAAERAEIERKAREAEQRLDLAGMAEADKAAKTLAKEEKALARDVKVSAGSHAGGGRTMSLVKRAYATVTDTTRAVLHYRNHPEMAALLERLATADARVKGFEGEIPGFQITHKEEAR